MVGNGIDRTMASMFKVFEPNWTVGGGEEEEIVTGVFSKADQVLSPTIPSATKPFFSEMQPLHLLCFYQTFHRLVEMEILKPAEAS